jgi:hypothetical protein
MGHRNEIANIGSMPDDNARLEGNYYYYSPSPSPSPPPSSPSRSPSHYYLLLLLLLLSVIGGKIKLPVL